MSQTDTVIISQKSYRSQCYHTDENCSYIPERTREVERSKLNGAYRHCEYCSGEFDDSQQKRQYEDKVCEKCGEEYNILRYHIPCGDD